MSELLTVREVAHILRVDVTTVRRWVSIGTLKAIILPHVGKRQAYRISRETIDKILDSDDRDRLVSKEAKDIDSVGTAYIHRIGDEAFPLKIDTL